MKSFLNVLNNSCNEIIPHSNIFPFELDDFQKHACYRISIGENVLVNAKTGVGKTVPAIYGIHTSILNNNCIYFYG